MMRKIKIAVVALLGFSTACSTVKSNTGTTVKEKDEQTERRVIVMYGVRPPKGTVVNRIDSVERATPQPAESEAPPSKPE